MIFEQTDEKQPLKQSHISWRKNNKRWIILVFGCLIDFGNAYAQEFPSVLQEQIEKQFDIDSFKYNLLFSVYSFPNIIFPLIGGILIDLIGIRKGLIFFPLFLLLGQGVCMLGSYIDSYVLLIVGRGIYGLGGVNNSLVQNTILSKWFKGKEIAFALGMSITFYRLGTILNSVITPRLYLVYESITLGLFMSLILLLILFICQCWQAYIEYQNDHREEVASISGKYREEQEKQKISLRVITSFKVHFWLVATISMLSYADFKIFQSNNVKMFKKTFQLDEDQAQYAYQIPLYMGLFTPASGILIDKVGQRPLILIISSLLLITVNLWFLLIQSCINSCFLIPLIGQIFLGFFVILLASTIWPTLPLCVPQHAVGTAFGISYTINNIGNLLKETQKQAFSIIPIIVGNITKPQIVESYRSMMVIFLSISVSALISGLLLKLYDKFMLSNMLSKKTTQTQKIEVSSNDQIE